MMLNWRKTNKLHTLIGVVLSIVLFNPYTVILLKHDTNRIPHVMPSNISNTSISIRPMKYILQWTWSFTEPFVFWGKGQEGFLKRKCKVNQCFVTNHRGLLRKITDFDAIAFHGPEMHRYKRYWAPTKRSERQKYIFVSVESSHYYPMCNRRNDNFFNWTWSYRLDSDVPYAYIVIRDRSGKIIGPRKIMNWISVQSMRPVSQELKKLLNRKKKAAAWFASNCNTKSQRENYVKQLQEELKKYNLEVDIFGKCGTHKCSLRNKRNCLKKIQRDYHFYMSMENSFSEDYVTEKLLTALQNFAIPVVFGAANYTRFMPKGIYLDAGNLSPAVLAKEMHNIMNNKKRFYNFFKWRNHYSYHYQYDSPDSDVNCKICEMLHDEKLMRRKSVHPHFRRWWNGKRKC